MEHLGEDTAVGKVLAEAFLGTPPSDGQLNVAKIRVTLVGEPGPVSADNVKNGAIYRD